MPSGKVPGRYVTVVSVSVECPDGTTKVRTWRGRSVKSIRASAKDAYKGCTVRLGRSLKERW